MKTILITGGANGIGKAIAMHYLKQGERVIAIGSSTTNGDTFYNDAKQFKAEERAVYMQANLSLVKENRRIIEEIKQRYSVIDMLIFCASKHSKTYTETAEGLELTFALDYLSRFIFSYHLKALLDKGNNPIIMNVCGTGMKGTVNWYDLQHKNSFNALKVMMHGSRLNDLSAVAFTQNDSHKKIKYILYNPMAVKTPGMEQFSGTLMKFMYKIIAKPIEKAVLPMIELLDNPPKTPLSAYKERKKLDLTLKKEDANKIYDISMEVLKNLS